MAKYLCIWVRAYWISVTSFSKWLPGGHIRFLGFWMAWFRPQNQVCFGISVSNFMCMSFVAVGRSLTIVSYVAFKMAALWFWTMFNCNPPIAHCHPLQWGGGILVDHWSTISSYHCQCCPYCVPYHRYVCYHTLGMTANTVVSNPPMTGIVFVKAPSQWETTLQCNVVSYWLGTFIKWSLYDHDNG